MPDAVTAIRFGWFTPPKSQSGWGSSLGGDSAEASDRSRHPRSSIFHPEQDLEGTRSRYPAQQQFYALALKTSTIMVKKKSTRTAGGSSHAWGAQPANKQKHFTPPKNSATPTYCGMARSSTMVFILRCHDHRHHRASRGYILSHMARFRAVLPLLVPSIVSHSSKQLSGNADMQNVQQAVQ